MLRKKLKSYLLSCYFVLKYKKFNALKNLCFYVFMRKSCMTERKWIMPITELLERNADLYGNEIKMPDTINDIIAQHDPEFRKFLYSIQ